MTDEFVFRGPVPDLPPVDELGQRLNALPVEGSEEWGVLWANFGQGVGLVYLSDADPPAGQFSSQR